MIFNRTREKREAISVNSWSEVFSQANGYEGAFSGAMKESVYFSCIKIIAESVSKCRLQVKQETEGGEVVIAGHGLSELLKLRPNPYMSAVDCMKAFVAIAKHNGAAGLLIQRSGSKVIGLYPVKITGVTIDDTGLIKGVKNNRVLWDYSSINGEYGNTFDKDIIVLKDFTVNGIEGKAVRNIASQSIDTSIKAQGYLNMLFGNGLSNRIAVQMTSDIKDEKEIKKIQEKFDRIYSNNGRVFTVPAGFNVSALNLSLSDAQFAELRRLSKEEIASCFQVPLSKLGIRNETAVSEEADNIKFLSDCLDVVFTAIEQEMDYKLLTESERKAGYKIRFNIEGLLRLDQGTQCTILTNYVQKGVLTINDARAVLGRTRLKNGDQVFMPSGQVSIDALVNGDVSYSGGSPKPGGKEGDSIDGNAGSS